MVQNTLTWSKISYRWGYQGQEKDGETSTLHFTFRESDLRLGRFWSVDPLTAKFPQWSPYQFAGNQVISSSELEGAEPRIDLNAKASVSLTVGTRKQSYIRFNVSVGGSVSGNHAQLNLNASGSLYRGGLGTTQGTVGDGKFHSDLALSTSGTFGGGGQGDFIPINTFSGDFLTSVGSTITNSVSVGSNYVLSSQGRNQAVGYAGFRLGNFSFDNYNDVFPALGDGGDEYYTGGMQANLSIGNGQLLTFGTDVFTGKRIQNTGKEGYKTFESGGHTYYKQSPGGANLSTGQTYLQFSNANGVNLRVSTIGKSALNPMWLQNIIHDRYPKIDGGPLARFYSFWKGSYGVGGSVGMRTRN